MLYDKVGVFGAQKTGLSAVKFLKKHSNEVYLWDDDIKKIEENKKIFSNSNIRCSLLEDKPYLKNLSFIIVSPGVSKSFPHPHIIFKLANKYKIPIKSDIELFLEHNSDQKFIGITGTNGKSTTSALLHHILVSNNKKSILLGNIGTPVLDASLTDKNMNIILELSSYQIDLLNKPFLDISVLLNISKDHLDRYGCFENYIMSKNKIFSLTKSSGLSLINVDNNVNHNTYLAFDKNHRKNMIPISSQKIIFNNSIYIENGHIYDSNKNRKFEIPKDIIKEHNIENLLSCFTVSMLLGVKFDNFLSSLSSFQFLSHRCETVLKTKKWLVINDSKATNIDSTIKPLQKYKNIYWIVGGILKDNDFSSIKNHLSNVKHCFIIGKDYKKFIDLAEKHQINYTHSKTLEKALIDITRIYSYGTILLSPACSSFDQWKNFEERGNFFKKKVLEILKSCS